MLRGVDTCAPINAEAARVLKAEGFSFVGRYLVPHSGDTRWKALTRAETARICAAGLRILSVWETTADRVKGGAEAGRADGARAAELARSLQLPPEAILYFAVDYDAGPGDYPAICAYLTAARAQTGIWEIGVYGSGRVIEAVRGAAPVKGFWQCKAWRVGPWSDAACVRQIKEQDAPECLALAAQLGFSVDIDDCEDLDKAGIWTYKEDKMTGAEIYTELNKYLHTMPLPEWAKDELYEAQRLGITDGTRPLELIPRYQAAIMAKRAVQAALREAQPMDEKAVSGLLTDD